MLPLDLVYQQGDILEPVVPLVIVPRSDFFQFVIG
jgi:hypothetical protein